MDRGRIARLRRSTLLGTSLLVGVFGLCSAEEPLSATFSSVLSNFNGPVPFGQARVAIDPGSEEVVVAEGRDVRVFNEFGMEVFSFRSPLEFGAVLDVAVEADGGILTLAYAIGAGAGENPLAIARHDYRGEKVEILKVSGLEGVFADLRPNRLLRDRDGLIVASTTQLLAVRTARDGTVETTWDLAELLEIPRADVGNVDISGLAADADGNLLATIGSRGLAVLIGADGAVTPFGASGSAEGTFGNIGGIARDTRGRIYVADKIRGVILVFGPDFRFLHEFGGQPTPYGTIGTPIGVWVQGSGKVFVTQVGERGVWVYDVRPN